MDAKLSQQLEIPAFNLAEVNRFLLDPSNALIRDAAAVIARYGVIEDINRKSVEARRLPNLIQRLRELNSPYTPDLEWLMAQRDRGAFISTASYHRKALGAKAAGMRFNKANAVTLEISALQYFP